MNSANGPPSYTLHSHIPDETLLAPDDCDSSGTPSSPQMKPRGLRSFDKYAPSEEPRPPKLSEPPISFDQSLPPIHEGMRLRAADAQLIGLLDNGRNPDIPKIAEVLPPITISPEDECDHRRWYGHPRVTPDPDRCGGASNSDKHLWQTCTSGKSLRDVAESVLFSTRLEIPESPPRDLERSTRHLSIHDNRPWAGEEVSDVGLERISSRSSAEGHSGAGLPPIVSPDLGANGQTLPSLRSIPGLHDTNPSASEQDLVARNIHGSAGYPHSPPLRAPHLPPLSASHGSPPISPPDSYPRSLPSPQSLSDSSPFNHLNGPRPHLITPEYSSTPTGPEAQSNEHVGGGLSLGERIYHNGTFASNAQPALYRCDFQGCKAPPFQTQYLLNSHANVHSQARPHYCPVAGCARSEGGKGFKRKNEMIRHGLVHESPGYICPFCPDKDHRYPRPDNLQRHVRVHHTDKSKDDAQLREVLAQRPDGPNRGRRRRGGA